MELARPSEFIQENAESQQTSHNFKGVVAFRSVFHANERSRRRVDRARTHVSDERNFAVGNTEVPPRALQTSECNELLNPTRKSCLILFQRQPGKLHGGGTRLPVKGHAPLRTRVSRPNIFWWWISPGTQSKSLLNQSIDSLTTPRERTWRRPAT